MSKRAIASIKETDETQYKDAVRALERGEDGAKTTIAFYKLSGRGGVEVDAERAVALLQERAMKNDDEALWMLGVCYEYGIGTKKDIQEAELHYQRSSQLNNVVGGTFYHFTNGRRGDGVVEVAALNWGLLHRY